MSLLAKIFGDCVRVRFEFELIDGRSGTGKMSIESIGHSLAEVEAHIEKVLFVEEGYHCKSLKIIGLIDE